MITWGWGETVKIYTKKCNYCFCIWYQFSSNCWHHKMHTELFRNTADNEITTVDSLQSRDITRTIKLHKIIAFLHCETAQFFSPLWTIFSIHVYPPVSVNRSGFMIFSLSFSFKSGFIAKIYTMFTWAFKLNKILEPIPFKTDGHWSILFIHVY